MLLATVTIYALCTFGPGGCGAAGDGFDATRPSDLALARAYKTCMRGLAAHPRESLARASDDCARKVGVSFGDATNYRGPMVAIDTGRAVALAPIPPLFLRQIGCGQATVTLDALGPAAEGYGAEIVTKLGNGTTASQRIIPRDGTDVFATCVGGRIALSEIDAERPDRRRIHLYAVASGGSRWTEVPSATPRYTKPLPQAPSCTACDSARAYWTAVDAAVRTAANGP